MCPAQIEALCVVVGLLGIQLDRGAGFSVRAIDERLRGQFRALSGGQRRECARKRARRERMGNACVGVELAEPIAEEVFPQQRLGSDDRLRVGNGALELEKSCWKLERQVDAVELAGGERDAGERRLHAAAAVYRARHVADGLRRAVIEEQPSRQLRRSRNDLVDQRTQVMLAFRRDDEAVAAARPGPELPHQARIDALQVLAHPAREIPFPFIVEEALQIVGPAAKCIPPGVNASRDALAQIVLFRIFTGRKVFPAHRDGVVNGSEGSPRARRYRAIPSSAWRAAA